MSRARTSASILFLTAVAAMVGCNSALVGTWKAEEPAAADGFAINTATFKDDNTYTASAKEGDQNVRLAGTYDFNGFNLKLKSPGKPDRAYDAMVVMGNTLQIKSGDKKVTMKKQ